MMKKSILSFYKIFVVAVLLFGFGKVSGQIAQWALTSDGTPSGVNANTTATDFTAGSGISTISYTTSGGASSGWSQSGIDLNDYFEVSVAPNATYKLNISEVNFSERRSGTGIRNYQVRWSIDNFASFTTIATVAVPDDTNGRVGNISGLNIDVAEGKTLKIRFYGYNSEAAGGKWRINSGTLNIVGTVTLDTPTGKTVTFKGNGADGGGTGDTGADYTQNASSTTNLNANTFKRTGYTYANKWNTAGNGSGTEYAEGASYPFTADATLYAQWTINNYTVTFDANGGTGSPSIASVNGDYNTTVTLAAQGTLAKTGYTFGGWNTAADGSGTNYAASSSYTIPASNITLYAKWTANNYQITFDKNNASATGTMSNQTIAYGATVPLTTNGFSLTGYIFDGWATTPTGAVVYTNGANYTMAASNVTLYAKWSVYVGPCHTEDFSGIGNTSSYDNRSWTGVGGTWTATDAREDQTINSKAITIKTGVLTSPSFSDGVGSITLTVKFPFGESSGNLVVAVNGTTVGTILYANMTGSTAKTFTFTGINVAGSVVITVTSAGARYTIDDLNWTCYTGTPTPKINLKGNGNSISNGDSTPSVTDDTDFGNTNVTSGTVVRTFTIENTGTAALSLTGLSPFLEISGTNVGDFSVTAIPSNSIAASSSTTFNITFDPSALGTRTATLSIANNDSTNNPYTFAITGTGSNSAESTIVDNTGTYSSSTPEFNISTNYADFTDNTNTSTGKYIPMKFKIVDGISDTDGLGTILTGIKFTVKDTDGNDRTAWIKKAILTTSGGTYIAAATTNAGQLVFSGMSGTNVTALTHSEKIVHLRVAFDETQNIIDNTKLIYKVVEATADTSGSSFAAADGSGAETDNSTSNNRNRIVVTATKLLFSTVNDGAIDVDLAAFTVSAADSNNKIDKDITGQNLTITTSGSNMTVTGTNTITNGVATVNSGIKFSTAQSGITLSASILSPSLSGTSNTFNIVNEVYAQGAFMSNTTGTAAIPLSYTTQTTWIKCGQIGGCTGTTASSGGWSDYGGNGTPGAASTVFIRSVVNNTGSNGAAKVTIFAGGELIINNNYPVSDLALVKDGGVLTIKGDFNMNNSAALFEVQDNAIVTIDHSYGNDPTAAIWDGKEKFHPLSKFYIKNWDSRQPLIKNNVDLYTENGVSAMFGNIYFEPGQDPNSNNGDYNDGIARQAWDIIDKENISPINLVFGNVEINKVAYNTNTPKVQTLRFMGDTNGDPYVVNIYGNLILNSTYFGNIYGATIGNFTLNVKKNLTINSGAFSVRASQTATGNTTLNLDGSLVVAGTGTFNLNQAQYTNVNNPVKKTILNLNGDVTATANSKIQSGCPTAESEFNFTGTSVQSVDAASVLANSFNGIPFLVKSGSSVKLVNNNLLINNSSAFTVEGGATLDFGYDGVNGAGTGGLYIGQPTSASGTNTFTSSENSILKITSPDGLYGNWDTAKFPSVTAATGNLRLLKSNRTINTLGTFWYIGKSDQKTGDAPNSTLSTTSNTKTVIAELSDNNKTLSLDVPFGLSGPGLLDIRKGKVLETTTNYIFGSTGDLKMAAGTKYKVVKGDAIEQTTESGSGGTYIPRMQGTYTLVGGEIELAGSGVSNSFQTLRGSRTYYDLTFSGGGSKTLSNGTSEINGLIAIMANTTLDGKSYTVGKPVTELLMDSNSLFKTGGNGPKPDAGGTYVLDPTSTIEFQGNSATKIRITPYENVIVSGTNVEPGGLNLLVNQKTVVAEPGKLKIPLTEEGDPSYVLTSTKGIDVLTNGRALFENNAQLMQSVTASNSGSILMQRNATIPVSTFNQYVYWSSPVIGQDYTKIFPGQTTTAQYYIESNDRFGASAGTYILGRGLAVKNPIKEATVPSTLVAEFTGTPYVGNYDYPLAWSNAAHGYNLVGNPYPSNLDLNELYTSSSNIESTFRFWDNYANSIIAQQGSNYSGYAYAKYNAVSKGGVKAVGSAGNGNGDPTSLAGLKEPNYILKVGQGFIARATGDNAKLSFKNGKRITIQTAAEFCGKNSLDSTNNRYWLEMVTPTNLLVSNAIVYFDQGTNEFSADDSKLEGQGSDALFTNAGDEKVVINGRSTFVDTDVVKVGNRYFTSGIYEIRLGKKEGIFENGQNIYLKDKIAGIITNLSAGNYSFSADAGEQTGRFEIIYKPESVLATGENTKDQLQVYRNGEDFVVQSGSGIIDEVEVFDASGRLFQKVKGGATKIVIDGTSLVNGMYILKINRKSDLVSKKIMK